MRSSRLSFRRGGAAGRRGVEVVPGHAGQTKNPAASEELIGYLEARRPYLPDKEPRRRAGLWIASNRMEQFYDGSISARCKHQVQAPEDGVDGSGRRVLGRAGSGAARWGIAPEESEAPPTRPEGPAESQESRLSDSKRRTDR